MIILEQLPNGTYKLSEYAHTFYTAEVTHWYYDMQKELISEEESFPDNLQTRSMTNRDIDWFNKYYLKLL